MSNWIAGIDVHKRMLAVVVADVAVEGEYAFEQRVVGTSPDQLRALAAWLVEHEVEAVVMESTAQELTLSFVPDGRAAALADGGAPQAPSHAQSSAVTTPDATARR
jgi:hypothetical protein